MKRRISPWALLFAMAMVGSVTGCKKEQNAAAQETASKGGAAKGSKRGGAGLSFPVDVITTASKKIEYVVTAPGTIDAFERVQVTARVAGAVDKVAFSEGQQVKKGDLLVVIDAARYQVQVNSARAQVEKTRASEADIAAQIARREEAIEKNPGLIPGEELSTYKTRGLTAKADTAVAMESLKSTQLNLRDASVRAPINGVIQTRTIETGQYVNAGYVMATLLRNDPMLLRFQVAPAEAPRIKAGQVVQFKLRESQRLYQAKVTLVAGAADESSRMVSVTAEVIDEGHKYWLRPGSFCDVTLAIGGTREVVVVPLTATRASDHGILTYVIEGDTARERVVQTGMHTRDGWVEIKEGLKPGEKLVLRGYEALIDGSKVKLTEVEPPPGPALPGTAAAEAAAEAAAAASASASAIRANDAAPAAPTATGRRNRAAAPATGNAP